jgi:ABC-type xylose transport system permease subunit
MTPPATPLPSGDRLRRAARGPIHSWAMAGVLIALWVALGLLPQTRDFFLTQRNLGNLLVQVSHIAVIAVGMTLVIILRGIDLSVGAGVALTGVVAALLQIDHGLPAWIAIAAALATGAGLGLWQGFFIARLRIPAFVVTLAGFNAFRGLALVLSDARGLAPMSEDFAVVTARLPASITIVLVTGATSLALVAMLRASARRRHLCLAPAPLAGQLARSATMFVVAGFALVVFGSHGLPVPVLAATVAAAVGWFIAEHTRLGRHVYAVGGNPEAARLSGIDLGRTTLCVYGFIGVLTAVAGVILAGRVNGVTPGNAGNLLELDVITAVVIGGTSLSGGRGTVLGSLLGALVFGTLANGMNLLDVSSNWQLILKGLILMAAVLIDVLAKRNRS